MKLTERRRRQVGWSRRALTLAEALLVGFMLSLVLGSTAIIVSEYSRMSAQSSTKDRVLAGAQNVLDTVGADLCAAAVNVSTSTGNPRLSLERVDPTRSDRVAPVFNPSNWQPWSSGTLYRVDYLLVEGSLLRRITPAGESPVDHVLSGQVEEFLCRDLGNGRFELVLTYQEELKKTRVRSFVVRRLGQEPPL